MHHRIRSGLPFYRNFLFRQRLYNYYIGWSIIYSSFIVPVAETTNPFESLLAADRIGIYRVYLLSAPLLMQRNIGVAHKEEDDFGRIPPSVVTGVY
jgi:hypothetical protein